LLARRAAGKVVDANVIVQAIMAASISCLRLTHAAEVIACLATSDRVCEDDIPLALSFPDCWGQHICIRKWHDIPTSNEVRAFVMGRKLTALSQYYVPAFFDDLQGDANQHEIVTLVQALFEQIRNTCPVDPPEYSMDIAVDRRNGKAFIIELNPFGKP
jgi:hypothetical protein